jgi:hypothetical protein
MACQHKALSNHQLIQAALDLTVYALLTQICMVAVPDVQVVCACQREDPEPRQALQPLAQSELLPAQSQHEVK